jgi:hypothetical protein
MTGAAGSASPNRRRSEINLKQHLLILGALGVEPQGRTWSLVACVAATAWENVSHRA